MWRMKKISEDDLEIIYEHIKSNYRIFIVKLDDETWEAWSSCVWDNVNLFDVDEPKTVEEWKEHISQYYDLEDFQ